MIRQKMDSLSFELLSRMAHMMTRMTHWLDSHDSLARWLAVCQDPPKILVLKSSSEQIFSRKLPLGAPEILLTKNIPSRV